MSRFEEMETFTRIVETGTISGAAKQMRVAKSAVSRRLKELEMRLGRQLFIRSTRNLTLTDEGRSLYDRAVSLLADWREAEDHVSGEAQSLSGRIRVAAPLSFGVAHLSSPIIDFNQRHPKIEFDIDFNDQRTDLIAQGIDVAFRIGALPDSNFIARKLAPISTGAFASPDYLETVGMPETPKDLSAMQEVRYGNLAQQNWTYTDPDGRAGTISIPRYVTANNGEFLCAAVVAGLGVVIAPRFLTYKAVDKGQLAEILSDYDWGTFSLYVVYPPTRHMSRRVRTFVDFMIAHFKDTPCWECGE